MIFLRKYHIVISDTLVGSSWICANIIRILWETKKERLSYRKKYVEEFVWGIFLFWLHALLFFVFLLLSSSTPSPFPSDVLAEWPLWRYIVLLWVEFCVMRSWVNSQKYENLPQFNPSWLASLRTWCYLRLCFRFSCSEYDLTFIKRNHTLNYYPF